jgi:hypothetical protein
MVIDTGDHSEWLGLLALRHWLLHRGLDNRPAVAFQNPWRRTFMLDDVYL